MEQKSAVAARTSCDGRGAATTIWAPWFSSVVGAKETCLPLIGGIFGGFDLEYRILLAAVCGQLEKNQTHGEDDDPIADASESSGTSG